MLEENKISSTVFFRQIKITLVHAGVFSFFFNVLLFASPIYMLQIYNRVLPARGEVTLLWLSVLVVALLSMMAVIDAVRQLIFVRLSGTFDACTNVRALARAFDDNLRNPSMIKGRVLGDLDHVRRFISHPHLLAIFDIAWLPLFIIALAFVHPILAIVAAGGASWLFLLACFNHKAVATSSNRGRVSAIDAMTLGESILSKAEVVRALGMLPPMMQRWLQKHQSSVDEQLRAAHWGAIYSAVTKASRLLIQAVTLGVGAHLAIGDAISAGAIVASSVLVGRALAPIEICITVWQELLKSCAAYQRLDQLFRKRQRPSNQTGLAAPRGHLSVEDLCYSIGGQPILRDLRFDVRPGQVLAVIGPSGAGKSTLARHLVGAGAGDSGTARLDDADLAWVSDDFLRRYIGYLPQGIHLFDGTVAKNICRFGTPDPALVLEAARVAGVHDMILRLPAGYDTEVGRDGCQLSWGQRQRLALARALYGQPALVVLDEPSAHLDEGGESALITAIAKAKEQGMTVVVMTHKINIASRSDLLLVMDLRRRYHLAPPGDILKPPAGAAPKPRIVASR